MLIWKTSTEKHNRSYVHAADDRNVGSGYEMPTVSATVGSPTYINTTFAKKDVTYEVFRGQPVASDHVYVFLLNNHLL